MTIKLFLFDLDGTLIDTAPTLVAAANRVIAEAGGTPLPLEILRPLVSKGAPGLLGKGLGLAKEHPDFLHHRSQFLSYYGEDISTGTVPFPGILEMIDALRALSVSVGIVTNKPESLSLQLLKTLNIRNRFNIVLGFDSPSCAMKPNPASLLQALKLTGVPPEEALYAGDDERDVLAAHAAGMQVASVAWGYSDGNMLDWKADCHAQAPSDLVDWVKRLLT